MKILGLIIAMVLLAGMAVAQPFALSGIDPKSVDYSGKLGIDVIGVGMTPSMLSFASHDLYSRDIFVIGGEKYTPPVAAKIGLMNWDHTRPEPAMELPSLAEQFAMYHAA